MNNFEGQFESSGTATGDQGKRLFTDVYENTEFSGRLHLLNDSDANSVLVSGVEITGLEENSTSASIMNSDKLYFTEPRTSYHGLPGINIEGINIGDYQGGPLTEFEVDPETLTILKEGTKLGEEPQRAGPNPEISFGNGSGTDGGIAEAKEGETEAGPYLGTGFEQGWESEIEEKLQSQGGDSSTEPYLGTGFERGWGEDVAQIIPEMLTGTGGAGRTKGANTYEATEGSSSLPKSKGLEREENYQKCGDAGHSSEYPQNIETELPQKPHRETENETELEAPCVSDEPSDPPKEKIESKQQKEGSWEAKVKRHNEVMGTIDNDDIRGALAKYFPEMDADNNGYLDQIEILNFIRENVGENEMLVDPKPDTDVTHRELASLWKAMSGFDQLKDKSNDEWGRESEISWDDIRKV